MKKLVYTVPLCLFVLLIVLLCSPVHADHCVKQQVQRTYAPVVYKQQVQQQQHHQVQQHLVYPFAVGYSYYPGYYSTYSPDLGEQLQRIKLENELLKTQLATQQLQQRFQQQQLPQPQQQQQYYQSPEQYRQSQPQQQMLPHDCSQPEQLQQRRPQQQQQMPQVPNGQPYMPGVAEGQQLVQNRCSSCHDSPNSTKMGGGLTLWSNGRPVVQKSEEEKLALFDALQSGRMPKHGEKLDFLQRYLVYHALTSYHPLPADQPQAVLSQQYR